VSVMSDVCAKCECELTYYETNVSSHLDGVYCAECYDLAIEGFCEGQESVRYERSAYGYGE
jgi:hypothetical protein